MDELRTAVDEVFGRFLEDNGFQPHAAIASGAAAHLIFANGFMKIRFSYGAQERLREATVTLGDRSAPDSGDMWHPLGYRHSPTDAWVHVGDFKRRMTDEEYDAGVLARFRTHGPGTIEPPSLHHDLRRYLREIGEARERIVARFAA